MLSGASQRLAPIRRGVTAFCLVLVALGGYLFWQHYSARDSITPLEGFWTVFWALVWVLALRFFLRTIRDELVRRREGIDGQARTVSMDSVWGSTVYVLWPLAYTTLGLFAMTFSPDTRHAATFPITISLLFLPGVVMIVDLIRREFIPLSLRRAYREEQEAKELAIKLAENTVEVRKNTEAVEAQTYMLENGPMHATQDSTRAMDLLVAALGKQGLAADVREDAAAAREQAAVERHEEGGEKP